MTDPRWTDETEHLVYLALINEPDEPDGLEEAFALVAEEDILDVRRILAALADAGLLIAPQREPEPAGS